MSSHPSPTTLRVRPATGCGCCSLLAAPSHGEPLGRATDQGEKGTHFIPLPCSEPLHVHTQTCTHTLTHAHGVQRPTVCAVFGARAQRLGLWGGVPRALDFDWRVTPLFWVLDPRPGRAALLSGLGLSPQMPGLQWVMGWGVSYKGFLQGLEASSEHIRPCRLNRDRPSRCSDGRLARGS